jgi:hypothetical protein
MPVPLLFWHRARTARVAKADLPVFSRMVIFQKSSIFTGEGLASSQICRKLRLDRAAPLRTILTAEGVNVLEGVFPDHDRQRAIAIQIDAGDALQELLILSWR